jgi:hypothetical protein
MTKKSCFRDSAQKQDGLPTQRGSREDLRVFYPIPEPATTKLRTDNFLFDLRYIKNYRLFLARGCLFLVLVENQILIEKYPLYLQASI